MKENDGHILKQAMEIIAGSGLLPDGACFTPNDGGTEEKEKRKQEAMVKIINELNSEAAPIQWISVESFAAAILRMIE